MSRQAHRTTRVKVRKKSSILSVASVSIMIVAILSLFWVIEANSPAVFQSPTATYSGYLAVSYTGIYHYVDAQPLCAQNFPPCLNPSEVVFYLTVENTSNIHLVFYCGLDYCRSAQQLPFKDGAEIYAQGTLLVPSEWPSNQYQPPLQFIADLYVFKYAAA